MGSSDVCASRSCGASETRTDFLVDCEAAGWEEDEAGSAVVEVAWAKSEASAGSFGEARVLAVEGDEKPWNWEVRSLYCLWRDSSCSRSVVALLRDVSWCAEREGADPGPAGS